MNCLCVSRRYQAREVNCVCVLGVSSREVNCLCVLGVSGQGSELSMCVRGIRPGR